MCDKKEGIRHCLFDMENWCCSDWSEEPALALCQTGLTTDSFLVPNVIPCQPPSESSSSFQLHGFPTQSWFEPFEEEEEEDRGASASKNHRQAEKRRRDRINAHLASLRKLVPNSDKMDKATLLRSVVEKVKELKKESVELSRAFTLPSDTDQVTVDSVSGDNQDDMFIKASICCDDRPELISELKNGIKGLKLKIVEAHVSSLGGRIKFQGIFIVCNEDEDGVGMDRIKQSVRVMLNRLVSSSSTTSNYRVKSKRQRFFFPSHHP